MDRASFERWLHEYVRRQEQGDATVVRELWADDGVYWWGPFNQPRRGVQAIYEANTEEAIRRSVFGSPTYFVDGDMFYGQDRLDQVARALRQPYGGDWP